MAENLKEYRAKRNFEKTAEPAGRSTAAESSKKSLRFAVQYHIARRVHYDFRLEWNGVLLSWAVPKGPSYNPRDKRLAVQVEDHPIEYAEFEGLIPKGQYGGGTVMLWDEGVWEPQFDFAEGLRTGSLKIVLYGRRLKGKWALVRLKEKEGDANDNWLLIKENDRFALSSVGIEAYDTSIRSGRTIAEIDEQEKITAQKNPMTHADVQLAKLADTVPEGDEWLYEIKYDGYRILAFSEGGETRLVTRNDHDYTDKFPAVAAALNDWSEGRAMVLDGEMVVTDEAGRPDFSALQTYVKNPNGKDLTYMVFDILALDGKDMRKMPLLERKERLASLMKDAPANLSYSKHVIGQGRQIFEAAAEMQLEGIVGKKIDSLYRGDRNGDWIKLKCYRRQEFVVGGYTLSDKKTSGISALLLGVYEGKKLAYAGRAGTGIGQRNIKELEQAFRGLKTDNSPFGAIPKARSGEKIFWLKPKLVAEVQFAEWTGENVLRQASFKGLRFDKSPESVVMEIADDAKEEARSVKKERRTRGNETVVQGIKISNPDKLVYTEPEVKKIDVIRYYQSASARMLAYTADRVLSVVRCHKGVQAACFFKKHPSGKNAGTVIVPVKNSEGKTHEYFYIENEKGLISEAQLGSLEFHIWGSRVDDLERPDMMVFDLDPDEGMDLRQIRQGVRDLKSVLDDLSLQSFLKTSGGKGYHVVVPLRPTVGWDAFHDFAKAVATLMENKWPDRYTDNMRKNKRAGKIFIDWARNGRGSTSVAPYSLRARPGARVSMPIRWSELDTVAPDGIDIFEAEKRLEKSDPWKDFFKTDQKLKI